MAIISRNRKLVLPRPLEPYAEPLPGVDTTNLSGKLIVIEGPDAVGRSTQVTQLRLWLEQEGHQTRCLDLNLRAFRESPAPQAERLWDLHSQ